MNTAEEEEIRKRLVLFEENSGHHPFVQVLLPVWGIQTSLVEFCKIYRSNFVQTWQKIHVHFRNQLDNHCNSLHPWEEGEGQPLHALHGGTSPLDNMVRHGGTWVDCSSLVGDDDRGPMEEPGVAHMVCHRGLAVGASCRKGGTCPSCIGPREGEATCDHHLCALHCRVYHSNRMGLAFCSKDHTREAVGDGQSTCRLHDLDPYHDRHLHDRDHVPDHQSLLLAHVRHHDPTIQWRTLHGCDFL